jgi:hypothetical protein
LRHAGTNMYTDESVQALVESATPESQALEFKQDQFLKTRPQRAELLKDLTGMGNGGGGTLLYGVAEDEDGHAGELNPLDDPSLLGKIENIVRAGVNPPLLYQLRQLEIVGGFVLEAVIEPSPIGPYMVTLYDPTEHRYFKRHGRNVDAMSEQEVRDAYALAMRTIEHRPVVWSNHSLPLHFNDSRPRVCVAALPLEPLSEFLDLRSVGLADIQPPEALSHFISGACDTTVAVGGAVLWAEGFAGTGCEATVRLHRDGAAGVSQGLPETMAPSMVARVVDGMLVYLGWLWQTFDLRRPVELKLSVNGLMDFNLLASDSPHNRAAVQPPGIDVKSVEVTVEREPWDISTPSSRHVIVRALIDRLVQAYGVPRVEVPFTMGHLYGPGSTPLGITLQPDLWAVLSLQQRRQLGVVFPSGNVKSSSTGRHVAHVDGGVIVDLVGDTLAVVELGVGDGYPDDCLPPQRATSELPEPGAAQPAPGGDASIEPPVATRRWSEATLQTTLDDFSK